MTRLRIAHLVIQPVLYQDDGEELSFGPQLEPANISLPDLQNYVDRLRAFIAEANTSGQNEVQK